MIKQEAGALQYKLKIRVSAVRFCPWPPIISGLLLSGASLPDALCNSCVIVRGKQPNVISVF